MALLLFALIGVTVGILTGLSASPVVPVIVPAILSLVAAIVAIMNTLPIDLLQKRLTAYERREQLLAVLCLTFGIVMGSVGGILIRSYELLVPAPGWYVGRLNAVPVAIRDDIIKSVLANPERAIPLFAGEGAPPCDELRNAPDTRVQLSRLRQLGGTYAGLAEAFSGEPQTIEKLVKALCPGR
jgi:hypothetical protein